MSHIKTNKAVLTAAELESALFNKGIELLARREHSRTELHYKLTSYGQKKHAEPQAYDEEVSQLDTVLIKVLDKLVEQGWQCDLRFAEAYCRSRLRKGYGRTRIFLELKQKGIPVDSAEAAFTETAQEHLSSSDVIYRTWQKKFHVFPHTAKEQAQQYRFLQYRGFSGEQISQLFTRLKKESEA